MKPTRDGFGEGLLALGRSRKDVVVLSGDLGDSTRALWFQKEFPDRFFELGIAEQDMISTAAGFALSGKIAFACSFGVFITGRPWEQIRTSVCNMNLNVKIVGSHCGISVGADGTTAEAMEDIAIMRAQVHMTVLVPCDAIETRKAALASAEVSGPVYLRFGRNPVPVITKEEDPFVVGKANVLRDGEDVAIFSCGILVYEALRAADVLAKEGIQARVVNMHTVKPVDRDAIVSACRTNGAIVTAEEHTIIGGLGSAVAEVVVEECPVPMVRVGIQDRLGESGTPEDLLEAFHLTAKDIAQAVRNVIRRKEK
ncbi:MAG: transketolase family protein [Candidatus Omnitrophota bacterium]